MNDEWIASEHFLWLIRGKLYKKNKSLTTISGGATAGANANENVFCGVFLNPASAQQANAVVKSSETPFRIRVNFDGTENTNPDETDQTNPANLGFQIKYVQTAC